MSPDRAPPLVLRGGPGLSPDPHELGGKAANLARLEAAGAAVPPWIVIPASAWASAPADSPADSTAGPYDGHPLWADLKRALGEAGLRDRLLAVRSSAVGEDAAGASFAGQFETVLGVHGQDLAAVRAAVERVMASAGTERVLAYAGLEEPPPMAVILQALVDATAAGVAFSADPVTGDRGTAVVSAVRGLGDALVSGEVDADTFRLASGTSSRSGGSGRSSEEALRVVDRSFTEQDSALVRVEGGTRWVELDAAEGAAPAITDDEAIAVARAVRDLARQFGAPQDVEWALEGALEGGGTPRAPRRLLILQARPITTLAPASNGERRVWDNSNIVESYAGVTTPLTYSFARSVYEDVYRQFCRVMGVEAPLIEENADVFRSMIGLVRGRVYYNLMSWYRVLSLLPGYGLNRAFMERMMGVREKLTDPPDPPPPAGRLRDLGRMMRMAWRMARASRSLRRSVPAFHERLDAALDPLADEDLAVWPPDRLLALYRRLENELLRHWQPPLVNDFFAMIWFGVLGRLTGRWMPDEPATLVNDLLAGEGGMISTEPARQVMALAGGVAASPDLAALFRRHEDDDALLAELRHRASAAAGSTSVGALADFAADLTAYLRRFGDRCADELKLETVTLSDDPGFLLATIRSYVRQGATDPDASRARERAIREEAEGRVADRLGPLKRRLYRSVLRRARSRIRDRENLRFERTRVFGVVRRIFLGLGHALHRAGRLDAPRDVFWLTTEEVFGWVDGTGATVDLRGLVRLRGDEFRGYSEGPPPPDRFETFGPPSEASLLAAQGPGAGVAAGEMSAAGEASTEGEVSSAGDASTADLAGTGCCPGVVRAAVRLVRDPRQAGDLGGRILVAERTDPGWTLLFPSAAGILVQRGSLLSHSAIVAREMGIPCVVSIPGLMDRLKDGELVEMDGATGLVRRVGEGGP